MFGSPICHVWATLLVPGAQVVNASSVMQGGPGGGDQKKGGPGGGDMKKGGPGGGDQKKVSSALHSWPSATP